MADRGLRSRAGFVAVRFVLAVTLVVAALETGSVPAAAKGITRALVMAGPGINAPIVVGDAATAHELARMSGLYGIAYGGETGSAIDRPVGDLGPRYVVKFKVALSGGPLPVRQHFYPYAGGGPVVHTPGGQLLEQLDPRGERRCSICRKTTATWHTATPELYGVLHDLELPEPRTTLAAARLPKVEPDRWQTVSGTDRRISLRIPAGWNTSNSMMLPVQVDPIMSLAVGTAAVEPQPVGECGIVPQRALAAVGPADAFVGIYVTSGLASWGATIPKRPKSFAASLPWRMGPMKCTINVTALLRSIAFEENGVKLTLLVATGPQISDERRAELVAVLESLDVAAR